jgi:hypothetical protein
MTEQSSMNSAQDSLAPHVAEALAAWHAGDPDGVPIVRIRAAYRNLSASQSGPECYRRVRYPGAETDEWPDAERLPPAGFRAAERRAKAWCDVPIGTIVVDFERAVYKGRRGKCKVTIGLVCKGEDAGVIEWLDHRTLRARPVYEVTLPDGAKLDIQRRERS